MMKNTPDRIPAHERYFLHMYDGRVIESVGMMGRHRRYVVGRFVRHRKPKKSQIKAIFDGNGRLVVQASAGGEYYHELDEFDQFVARAAKVAR